MDHLPKPATAISVRLSVAYLAAGVPRHRCLADADLFVSSRQRFYPRLFETASDNVLRRLDAVKHDTNIDPNIDDTLMAHVQSWLYFDLLAYVFGPDFCETDFIRRENGAGDVITSHLLPSYMQRWHEERSNMSHARKEHHKFMCMSATRSAWHICNSFDTANWIKTSRQALVLFSIRILITSLDDMMKSHPNAEISTHSCFAHMNQRVRWPHLPNSYLPPSLVMAQNGWSPREIIYAMRTYNCCSLWYLMHLSRPPVLSNYLHDIPNDDWDYILQDIDHQSATSDYRPKHLSHGCHCSMVGPDIREVNKVLQSGGIPIINCSQSKQGQFEFKVRRAGKRSRYIAISHVWSDGMNVPGTNSIYHCQLAFLIACCNKAKSEAAKFWLAPLGSTLASAWTSLSMNEKSSVTLWLDLFCVPTQSTQNSSALKATAISLINPTFAGAEKIVVVDRALTQTNVNHMDRTEIAARVATSVWMSRCWTLLEASLGSRNEVYFCFNDKTLGLNRLSTSKSEGPSVQSCRVIACDFHLSLITFFVFFFSHGVASPSKPDTDFRSAWNALANRSTSRSEDVWTILGILLGYDGKEIMSLPVDLRLQALLYDCSELPLSFLTQRLWRSYKPRSGYPHWIPASIDHIIPLEPTLTFVDGRITIAASIGHKLLWTTTEQLGTSFMLIDQGRSIEIHPHELEMLDPAYHRSRTDDRSSYCVLLVGYNTHNQFVEDGKVMSGFGTCLRVKNICSDGSIEAEYLTSLSWGFLYSKNEFLSDQALLTPTFEAQRVEGRFSLSYDQTSWPRLKSRRRNDLIYLGKYLKKAPIVFAILASLVLISTTVMVICDIKLPLTFKERFTPAVCIVTVSTLTLMLILSDHVLDILLFRNYIYSFRNSGSRAKWWRRLVW